jgi:hypothetical protein
MNNNKYILMFYMAQITITDQKRKRGLKERNSHVLAYIYKFQRQVKI